MRRRKYFSLQTHALPTYGGQRVRCSQAVPAAKKVFLFAITKPLLAKERPHKSPGKIRRGGVSAWTA